MGSVGGMVLKDAVAPYPLFSLEAPAKTLSRWENLQAGCPPAGQDCLDEFLRQVFLPHLVSKLLVIIDDRQQFRRHLLLLRLDGEERVPDGCLSIIRWAANSPNVDNPFP